MDERKADDISEAASEEADESKRGTWGGKLDFLLSCIGYSVGLGTIWRFPYLVYKNGGGAFLIPYLLYLVLFGLPLVLLELGYGQFSSLSPIAVWRMSPIFQGVGWGMVLISGVVCVYYNVIIAWTLYYLGHSFRGELPWSRCDNPWNTPNCVQRYLGSQGANASNASDSGESGSWVNASLGRVKTPSEEYWEREVLQIQHADGISDIGGVRWELAVCLLVAWIFIFLCLFKGVKTSGKVVYVTATLPYLLLIIFLIRGVTLPGSLEGIRFYVIPDLSKLASFQPWGDAAMQLFYSIGAAWGALITMASYNKFNNNFYRDAIIVAIADTITAFLAGLVIFSIIGFMAHNTGLDVSQVVTSGPGLVFVVYPEAISWLPVSPLWAVLFFLFLFTVGVDSQFGMFETLVSACMDQYPVLRKRKVLFTASLCVVEFLLGLPCITHGGIYFLQIMDWYCSTFSLMALSLAECLAIAWVYGADRFYQDIELMIGRQIPAYWKWSWKVITPTMLSAIFCLNVVKHEPVRYGAYEYPGWAVGLGLVFALVSLVPMPLVAVIKVLQQPQGSLWQRIKCAARPEADWGPADHRLMAKYQAQHSGRTHIPLNGEAGAFLEPKEPTEQPPVV